MKISPSISKQGDLCISPCNFTAPFFPLDKSPYTWNACDDAYKYSWSKDFNKDLISLTSIDKIKLIHSMGFCPQNRCQLYNITQPNIDGYCPESLCYTKIENGGLSYGACCFKNGVFNSGVLIGYYNKSQPSPKPIYKKSRIVLGNKRGSVGSSDESFDSYINANELHTNLIGTQCPLSISLNPLGYIDTINDVKRMIIENSISLWIQLAPSGLDNYFKNNTYIQSIGNCGVFPLEYFMNSNIDSKDSKHSIYNKGITNFEIIDNKDMPYMDMKYTLTAYVSISPESVKESVIFDYDPSSHSGYTGNNDRNENNDKDIHFSNQNTVESYDNSIINTDNTINNSIDITEINMPNSLNLKCNNSTTDADIDANITDNKEITENNHATPQTLFSTQLKSEINEQTILEINEDTTLFTPLTLLTPLTPLPHLTPLTPAVPIVWKKVSVDVRHIWYHKWRDFSTPPPEDDQTIRYLAKEAAKVLHNNTSSVVVSCLSGRGRTGTFSALVLGELKSIKTHTELIDIIVSMRENRDGLVETPAQFRYAAILLGLPDTKICKMKCKIRNIYDDISINNYYSFLSGILFSVLVICAFFIISKYKFRSKIKDKREYQSI